MHRSRLTTILFDCNQSVFEKGVAFWSGALGLKARADDERYVVLEGRPGGTRLVLQRVPDPSAYHVDIETDDVEAEVARLEKLGAVRKYKIQTWWVMRAPSGHDFCVIRPQSDDFADEANVWDDAP
ncbi:MAG TPA: VOC family protein [Candidatus Acidoferrum sp.]|nr:VOC family protein [Candidatus Acidoferrum sp.]